MLKVRLVKHKCLHLLMVYCDFPGLENGDLKTNPNEIVEKVTDRADLFTGFIHENYLEYFPDIQSAFKCAENLELASRLAKDSVILCQALKFNLSATFYCLMMITPFGIGIINANLFDFSFITPFSRTFT